MATARTFDAADTAYVEALYQQYQADEASVSPEWRAYFIGLEQAGIGASGACTPEQTGKALAVQRYIQIWRARGHLGAWINPLQRKEPDRNEELTLAPYGLGDEDLDTPFHTHGVLPEEMAPLKDIRAKLIEVYGHHTGIETLAVRVPAEREWVRAWWENPANRQPIAADEQLKLYEGLVRANALERTLHTKFVGAKRFSIEGTDAMVPVLLRMVERAVTDGAKHMVLGMAHRGRLNMLCNVFHKPYADLFAAYAETFACEGACPLAGDVKYHMGKVYNHQAENGDGVELELMYNPSHLEAVNPLVLGAARAKAAAYGRESGMANFARVLPVLIHGDSAVAGQGIVAECNNLMALEPYNVGGTIHIIANNQVGFTADPTDAVSGDYCTDIFKSLGCPIVHVNADDVEACLRAARFALDYRKAFGKDAVIDVYGYRRWGHNEGDDPTFTQPLLYALIKDHPVPAEVYRAQLLAGGMDAARLDAIDAAVKEELEASFAKAKEGVTVKAKADPAAETRAPATAVKADVVGKIAKAWAEVPERFMPNSKVAKVVEERIAMLNGDKPLNWGAAETAAYGALLHEGITVRLTGQDARRGTFSHRHAVLTDSATGGKWSPLATLASKGARCAIHNSALSENAVMGFEYGYAHAEPEALVLWEAQFGDFANGAQVVIDQFLAAAEAKWGQMNGLGLLLPHGQEGQGPEHSSARLERYLQLCGQGNMRVCMPSTPAQIFHLLRRQALWPAKRPLVVMTPKSLLRHPAAVSDVSELVKGAWQPLITDAEAPKKPKRVVLCSGKVYYDLAARRAEMNAAHVALLRVEELYPWPADEIAQILKVYGCKDIWWVQEEPRNMGAWWYVQENWQRDWGFLHYAGRPTSASPAAGTTRMYQAEQNAILDTIFGSAGKQEAA
ncbi:MAG: 2-oxoglutarate dehydrogenase E1 component [Pseudomonadaceae bacterium]|nr:2-oxoglutarate dehydrogenase E1 component [Pseudomonadaceae bacterium]